MEIGGCYIPPWCEVAWPPVIFGGRTFDFVFGAVPVSMVIIGFSCDSKQKQLLNLCLKQSA